MNTAATTSDRPAPGSDSAGLAGNLYDVLHERGLVSQCTEDESAIRARLSKPVTCYIGFDPTADSLHVGSLLPLMLLAWAQRCGHHAIAVVGGGTALVGDPAGKNAARKMLTPEQIQANARGIREQMALVLDFDRASNPARLVNNADWLAELKWVDLLREAGAVLSVNRMVTMDSVRSRMEAEDSGISFLEFNYMVMQAYDFLHLHRTTGCTLQMGGQDQWGNIVMGIELGRRLEGASLAGLTTPLATKADGSKFGKSESGNVWLDAERTSPYEFFQFWRNTPDAEVGSCLRRFTFLPVDRVQELGAAEGKAINDSKELLAFEVTRLVHGEAEAERCRDAARKAFGGGDVTAGAIPSAPLDAGELEGDGAGLLTLLVRAKLAGSNGEARRLIQGGGVRIGDAVVGDIARKVTPADVVDGYVLLRVGKKKLFRYDVA
ncbi:MAG: tyrosine--tRNA ligase [Planctomycetota bacterium]